jgi:hypothetical protein
MPRTRAHVPRETPEERFWKYVWKTDGCWVWTACTSAHGYGQLSLGGRQIRRMVYTHIFSWELHIGAIPKGMQICHRCDNPPCVRPDHLFLGTQAQNMADASAKGRIRLPDLRGAQHPMAKLSAGQVIEIRQLWSTGNWLQRELGERFGVSQVTISRLLLQKNWRHEQPLV